ncbi:MAG: hypothetical protein KDA78_19705 [Planctomycetaceae bacterium]|nr:hypothetical protein [Planctomycetaceae bacterium]
MAQAVTAPTVAERTLQTRRIDEIRPGMRVLAENPIVEDTHPDSPEPDPLLDRLIQLRMKKADETDVLISLIRPLDWIQFHNAHPGVLIHLDYEEFGAIGEAEVLQILPCPSIESGQGEVVTGTFQHTAHELLEIWVEGEDQPIRTTPSHRWWSEERGDYVTASELQENEALRLASGEISPVAKITKVQSAETVYNLEVNREHVYYVGSRGILVHNEYKDGISILGKTHSWFKKNKPKGWSQGPPRSGHGWKWVDENGRDRLRYMYPDEDGQFVAQRTGYFRRNDSLGNFLDVDGNIIPDDHELFNQISHIPYSGN